MSDRGRQSLVAREGRPVILLLLLLALLVFKLVGPAWSVPLWFAALLVAFLYRDPQRRVPPLPLAVVSPVDGRVLFVKKIVDPYLQRQAIHVRLQINRFGVFGLRSPIEGKMLQQWLFKAGMGRNVLHLEQQPKKGMHYALWIQTDEQDDVVMILDLPYRWQKLQFYLHVGERIGQGQRCGRTRYGGYVDIFMAENVRMGVGQGDRVTAGVNVIATMIHK